MHEIGEVISACADTVTVRMKRTEACAHCRACEIGGAGELRVVAKNECAAREHDRVRVELRPEAFLKAALILYGLPLMGLLIGIALGDLLGAWLGLTEYRALADTAGGLMMLALVFFAVKRREPRWRAKGYTPAATEVKFRMQIHDPAEICPLTAGDLPKYADIIRRSFATVATDFGWTRENCPGHTSFVSDERLAGKIKNCYFSFGLYVGDKIVGFVSLTDMGGCVYEMNDVSVLPEWRHYGYGRKLIDFCKEKVKELGGNKITIGIVEENFILKDWYTANGFVHTGTKTFDGLPFKVGFMTWEAKANG
jgi:positive regulator of sigma E activity/ribosomal protein S18 acetylase RimI-like enzyme